MNSAISCRLSVTIAQLVGRRPHHAPLGRGFACVGSHISLFPFEYLVPSRYDARSGRGSTGMFGSRGREMKRADEYGTERARSAALFCTKMPFDRPGGRTKGRANSPVRSGAGRYRRGVCIQQRQPRRRTTPARSLRGWRELPARTQSCRLRRGPLGGGRS